GPAPEADEDLLLDIDRKLAEGRTDDAESLLLKCVGEDCNSRWNSLAVVYESRNERERAVKVYRHLFDLEKNEAEKRRIADHLKALDSSTH
ncbi:MAG: hypothetical protein GXP54_09290, partial [Deltaproteobacteria bacterium]|nr:hypothetical protein [Deltaproteobacteria bacterium]